MPWRIPASVENGWVSTSVVITVEVLSVYITLIAVTISSGIPYSPRISNIFNLSTESKAFEKSTNTRARSNLLALDYSISLLRQIIWLKVDLPRLKPFWFLRSIGSTKGMRRLSINLLYILASMDIKEIPL